MSGTKAHRSSLVLGGLEVHNAAAGPAGTLRVPRREIERVRERRRLWRVGGRGKGRRGKGDKALIGVVFVWIDGPSTRIRMVSGLRCAL